MFDRRNVEAAAIIHVTAESEAIELRALGLNPRRIEVVPNGIDVPAAVAADPSREAPTDRAPYVLFLGRISWKKGLDRLIAAMSLVEGVDLVIAGYDEDGYQSIAERLTLQARVRDRTHFVGPVEGGADAAGRAFAGSVRVSTCFTVRPRRGRREAAGTRCPEPAERWQPGARSGASPVRARPRGT